MANRQLRLDSEAATAHQLTALVNFFMHIMCELAENTARDLPMIGTYIGTTGPLTPMNRMEDYRCIIDLHSPVEGRPSQSGMFEHLSWVLSVRPSSVTCAVDAFSRGRFGHMSGLGAAIGFMMTVMMDEVADNIIHCGRLCASCPATMWTTRLAENSPPKPAMSSMCAAWSSPATQMVPRSTSATSESLPVQLQATCSMCSCLFLLV